MSFFPELIAGPIVRASVFLPQMARPIGPTPERLRTGLSIFLVGLSKKLLIADHMASVADPIFADPGLYAPATLWMGVLAYALQIYCDFSGYSDMAIGTAKMIGYDLPENFRLPYLAQDVSDFWRRWHVTLSTWLRDYLYIPLGGNRGGEARTYVNLLATMLLGGLWHGSSWNFVLWGALHGSALVVHRAARAVTGRTTLLPTPIAQALTFFFVLLCWVPFRAPDFPTSLTFLSRMFQPGIGGVLWVPSLLGWAVAAMVAAHAFGGVCEAAALGRRRARAITDAVLAVFGAELRQDAISGWYIALGLGRVAGVVLIAGWILLLYFYAPTGVSPFIYFQF